MLSMLPASLSPGGVTIAIAPPDVYETACRTAVMSQGSPVRSGAGYSRLIGPRAVFVMPERLPRAVGVECNLGARLSQADGDDK